MRTGDNQPTFPSRAEVEARLRAENPAPAVPAREGLRAELDTRGDVYGALLERLADKAMAKAAGRRDKATSRAAALLPITLRITKKDAPVAMLGGVLGSGGSFKDALAAVINGRLAALGSTEIANVEADLAARRAFASVTIGVEPEVPPSPAPIEDKPVLTPSQRALLMSFTAPDERGIPINATLKHFIEAFGPHREVFDVCFRAVHACMHPSAFMTTFGSGRWVLDNFYKGGSALPRAEAYPLVRRVLETIVDKKVETAPLPVTDGQIRAALTALASSFSETPGDASPRRTSFEQLDLELAAHRPVLRDCLQAALRIAVDYRAQFGIDHHRLRAFYNGQLTLEPSEARQVLRRVLTDVRNRGIYHGHVTVAPEQIDKALAALATPG